MPEAAVLYDVTDRVATITLNRPDDRNTMTPEILGGLRDSVAQARADADVRCVIVTGRGSCFCAGANLKSGVFAAAADDRYVAPQERSYQAYAPFLSMLDIEVPTIAAMQGHAIGGGLGLAVVCDLRVANRDAKYGANFVRLGLSPGMATTYLLPRLMGVPRGVEFLLTGRIVTGAEAADAGLVNYAVEPDAVLAKAQELAQEIATAAPLAVKWTKQTIYQNLAWDPATAARMEALVQSRTNETEDFGEGIAAMLQKRQADFHAR